ncbi:Helicase POLQ-like [Frankliniella fusca]|uniref:Helicase POLQ-like n=1 Tax=Frankliniella fusca TaxID=407009 RepID=A0AAE1HC36_9NEOP|nr:Helicase POLQ-like [Frankliniella fusca]
MASDGTDPPLPRSFSPISWDGSIGSLDDFLESSRPHNTTPVTRPSSPSVFDMSWDGDIPDDWDDLTKYRQKGQQSVAPDPIPPGPDVAVAGRATTPPGHRRQGVDDPTTATTTTTTTTTVVEAGDDELHLLRYCDEETRLLIRPEQPAAAAVTVLDEAGGKDFYGMGGVVRTALYEIFNITRLHPWQRDVLDKHLIHEETLRKNGLVVAPTSGGKTLVAIVLALHSLLVKRKDAMMVLPFVAIVQEKVEQLQRLATRLATIGADRFFAVAEFAGDKGHLPLPPRRTTTLTTVTTLFVCTIEKGNIVWRYITKEPPPFQVGCVIVDELQMLGEAGRGGIFEDLVSSVLFWAGSSTRLYALSATVGNGGDLAAYLGGGHQANCILHRVPRRPDEERTKEHVVVSGGAFRVVRDTEDGASARFSDGGFDVVAELDHATLKGMPVQGDDGEPHRLWLRIHQMRLHVQTTCLIKLPHRPGSERIRFPSVTRVPSAVAQYCDDILADGNDARVRTLGLDPEFVRGVAALAHGDGGRALDAVDTLTPSPYGGRTDRLRQTDAAAWDMRVVAVLVMDAIRRGRSVIVFCPTRAAGVATCHALTAVCRTLATRRDDPSWPTPSHIVSEERQNITEHLTEENDGVVDDVLLQGIRYGIAYHTAALSTLERTVVEGAFAKRVISVICATTTLAAGVNLPCDTVVIRSPWSCGEFMSCSRYLQMIGRAGRTGLSRSHPDAYVLVASEDVGRFQRLLECHVEDVFSQLLQSPPYFQKGGGGDRSQLPLRAGSCLTRFIVGVVATSTAIKLSGVVDAFRCTLLYQAGPAKLTDDDPETALLRHSTQPLLEELMILIRDGHIQVLVRDPDDGSPLQLRHYQPSLQVTRRLPPPPAAGLRDRQADAEGTWTRTHRSASQDEVGTMLALLKEASVHVAPSSMVADGAVALPDVVLMVTALATAADLATLHLPDAARFLDEARTRRSISLHTPLSLLIMSLEPYSCRLLGEDDAIRVNKELAQDLEAHEDVETITAMSITSQKVDEWLSGRRIRGNVEFNERLSRLWAALFVKGVFVRPEDFEDMCRRFGYDRSTGADFLNTTAQRCNHLRQFCDSLGDVELWWYRPLAGAIVRRIKDACAEELRPLLAIRHVSAGRAKKLYDAGYRDVAAVACIYPPTILTDVIPNLGVWRAIDMVLHARTILRHEAIQHAAQSRDRFSVLTRGTQGAN